MDDPSSDLMQREVSRHDSMDFSPVALLNDI